MKRLLLAIAICLGASAAHADLDADRSTCANSDAAEDARLAACSAVLDADGVRDDERARVLLSRGDVHAEQEN